MPKRTINPLLFSISSLLLASKLFGGTGAYVECWAPGLSAPVILDSYGQGIGAYAGRPWRYVIKGYAGSLTLGDWIHPQIQANSDGDFVDYSNNQVDSWATVRLQVNWQQFYPGYLQTKGDSVGVTTGVVNEVLGAWDVYEEHGYRETTLVFHLNNWSDLNAMGDHPNRNPYGSYYVIADYYEEAPEPSGELEVDREAVFRGETVTLSWNYDRGDEVVREQLYPSSGGGSFGVDAAN